VARAEAALARVAPALALALLAGCDRAAPPAGAPNVVLITLESLRVDHVGAYGGHSRSRPQIPVTPAIDAFAAQATVYEDAHAVTSWTLASHASLFTGLYPSGHQTDGPRDRLHDSYPTLAEALTTRGYQTAGVVSGPYLRRTHNLQQGFGSWDESSASITNAVAHDDVTNPGMEAALRRFVEVERASDRPFFLFAYFWDPHYDYLPPSPYDEMFVGPGCERFPLAGFDHNQAIHAGMSPGRLAFLLSQYAGELRWTDEHLGRFFALLRERGLWDETLVVVTSDHGEEFFEHGAKGHKNNVYAETVHVPLIVKYPGQREGRRDTRLVSLVDVLPTVLDVVGAEAGFPVQGRSLRTADADLERPIFFELRSLWYFDAPGRGRFAREERWTGVRRGDFKLVLRHPAADAEAQTSGEEGAAAAPVAELFHVASDPREASDVAGRQPERVRSLERSLADGLEQGRRAALRYERGGPARLTQEEAEQLRALGYLDS
jgi:arylsulfatase A-like enzyme